MQDPIYFISFFQYSFTTLLYLHNNQIIFSPTNFENTRQVHSEISIVHWKNFEIHL